MHVLVDMVLHSTAFDHSYFDGWAEPIMGIGLFNPPNNLTRWIFH
jgi:hypothetical protein